MKKDSRKYNIYHGVMAGGRWVLFAIVSFIILFPVYWIFISSITPSGELFKTPIDYLPDHPTLESYKFLIENVGLLSKVGNTVLIVGLTLVISTVLCAMAAYGFSRFTTKGINIAFAFIIATMLIPEVVTARPLYEFMQKVKLWRKLLLYICLKSDMMTHVNKPGFLCPNAFHSLQRFRKALMGVVWRYTQCIHHQHIYPL